MNIKFYNMICDKVLILENSKYLINNKVTMIKYENTLKQVNKLLNDEYRYGSSNYDLKCLNIKLQYLDVTLSKFSIIKSSQLLD